MSPPDVSGQRKPPAKAIDPQISARIKAARVVCILALVFVHVPPWTPPLGNPPRDLAPFDYAFFFLCEGLSRASVPLLSLLSGYLLVTADRGSGHPALLARKARSLLVPLILWNLISASMRAVTGTLGPADARGWLDRLVALSNPPLVVPLYFLRDLFVCVLVSPLLLRLLQRRAGFGLVLLAVSAITGMLDAALINPLILVFFAAGCAIALGTFPVRRPPPATMIVMAFLVIASAATSHVLSDLRAAPAPDESFGAGMLLFAQRTAGALFFWHVAGVVARSRWKRWIARIEPFIFFHFCAHTLILGALWTLLNVAGVGYGDPFYIVYFLTAPFTSLAIALAAATALVKGAPWALKPLCAGRLPRWRDMGDAKAGVTAWKAA